jgi:hypothetical protein
MLAAFCSLRTTLAGSYNPARNISIFTFRHEALVHHLFETLDDDEPSAQHCGRDLARGFFQHGGMISEPTR